MNNFSISDSEYNELIKLRARKKHYHFMKYCWIYKNKPMLTGEHTIAICDKIDYAFERFRNGQSTFLMILVCFRQGKSEITSRFAVPHFLAEFPENEVLLCSHNDEMTGKFSRYSQLVINSAKYKDLYPDITLDKDRKAVEEYMLSNKIGKAQYISLKSGTAGIGGDFIVVDDYCGKREDAESKLKRNKVIDAITNDVLTRRHDPCIFLMTVTPWHVDDVVGEFKKRMVEDKTFPQFEVLEFPAFSDKYKTGILFPEKYSMEWYLGQKSTLGDYAYQSLMQVNPKKRGGKFLRVDKITKYKNITDVVDMPGIWVRGWDIASTTKQVNNNDPDYTVGVKIYIKYVTSTISGLSIPICYIDDVVRGRWEATQRVKIERETAIADTANTYVYCESIAGYKDNYTTLKNDLAGLVSVYSYNEKFDKISKIQDFAVALEAGNVYIKEAPWNDDLISELEDFPSGSHDDIVDAISTAWYGYKNSGNISLFLEPSQNLSNGIDAQFVAEMITNIKYKTPVTCQKSVYFSYLRNEIIEYLKTEEDNTIRRFGEAEIKRIDLEYNFEHTNI